MVKLKIIYKGLIYFIVCLSVVPFSISATAATSNGNSQGNITIVEFLDYQCPHCRLMTHTLEQVIQQHSDIRILYKPVPLLNQASWLESQAVLAAHYQKKSELMQSCLMKMSVTRDLDSIYRCSKWAGTNKQQLVQDMKKPAIQQELMQNIQDFQAIQGVGLPTLLVGKTHAAMPMFRFTGEITIKNLQYAIQQLKP